MTNDLQLKKSYPFTFVPITKTPWGGYQIARLKQKYFPKETALIPDRIGESLEIRVKTLLLKWIDAAEPLSVQVHPHHSHKVLQDNECGKHEAWFIYNVENPSPLYLGFKEGYSQQEIKTCLQSQNPLDCLHSFLPQKNSYITIPPGCVHALGTGTFIAEPQHVLEKQEGKTLRIFDWNRLYNSKGERDESGSPRELHLHDALKVIDWELPRGVELEKKFVKQFKHEDYFDGDIYNPFVLQTFLKSGKFTIPHFAKYEFSLLTVFSGSMTVFDGNHIIKLSGGESACLPKAIQPYVLELSSEFNSEPCALLFSYNPDYDVHTS